MTSVRKDNSRLNTKFHHSAVSHVLPEFFEEDYPKLISFLDTYYHYTGEDGTGSFDDKIRNLFNIRDISSTDIENLDLILKEIGNGLDHSSFAENPRLMAKLISSFYRAKGTQITAEQFFKSFYDQDVEIQYPKRSIFILNESKIGPESLKFIQDDKRYQIYSILIKTGLSFSDYETLYRKFVHPAGFYLSADVVAQTEASLGLKAGDTTDPLETPNYPVVLETMSDTSVEARFELLTMRETDVADADIIISSVPLVSTYGDQSWQQLQDDGFTTLGDLVSLNSPATIDAIAQANSDNETIDTDDYK